MRHLLEASPTNAAHVANQLAIVIVLLVANVVHYLNLALAWLHFAATGASKIATTAASTAAKAAGEAGDKATSMSQNISSNAPDKGNSQASATKSDKVDAFIRDKI